MKIVIIINIFLSLLCKFDKSFQTDYYLNYENYSDDRIYLPVDFPPANKLVFEDSTILPVSCLKDIHYAFRLESHIFNMLINNWVINHLNQSFQYKNYSIIYNIQDYLKSIKQDVKLYYLGKINIRDSFESHLILLVKNINDPINNESTIRYVFLLNEKNSRIKSVIEISSYYESSHESTHIYTKLLPNGSYDMIRKILSSDVIVTDESGEEVLDMYDEQFLIKFYIDNEGFLLKSQP